MITEILKPVKKMFLLSQFAWWCGCNPTTQEGVEQTNSDSATVAVSEPVALLRDQVKQEAVATYEKKIPNALNNYVFKVQLFETKERFAFKVAMQYEAMTALDTIRIPNLQAEPKVALQAGTGTYSCIIGFYDQEENFKPYKEVSAKGEHLRITTIRHYTVTPVQ